MIIKIPENVNDKIANNRTDNLMNSSLIESIAFWSGVATVFATAIAALTGSLSWYFSHKVSSAKDEALIRFKEESKVDIAKANKAAAIANARAAFLDNERIKLEARIAPRRLSPEMQATIALSLKSFSGHTVIVKSYALDTEAVGLGLQIINSLEEADITTANQLLSAVAFNSVISGVQIIGRDKGLTENLINNFSSIGHITISDEVIYTAPQGFNLGTQKPMTIDADAIIFIGIKPLQQ